MALLCIGDQVTWVYSALEYDSGLLGCVSVGWCMSVCISWVLYLPSTRILLGLGWEYDVDYLGCVCVWVECHFEADKVGFGLGLLFQGVLAWVGFLKKGSGTDFWE